MTKVVIGSKEQYYLSLDTRGATLTVDKKGVKIILSNGQALDFPDAEISVDVAGGTGYTYSAFIAIDQATISLLQKYAVVKWRVYIYDGDQSKEHGAEFLEALNCLVKVN